MDFYRGGLYSQYRDEGCFIKYMADAIQSAQFHLKNEQWDINTDFEEFITSIRNFGEPLCIWNWHNMRRDEKSGYLKSTAIGLIDWGPRACADCPFGKDKSWQKDPEILNGIKLTRDALGRCDCGKSNFIESQISRFFPHLLQLTGNRFPENVRVLRRHYTAPKLFSEDIETEVGMRRMFYFLDACGSEPLIQFYQALVCCQERLYFPLQTRFDDEGVYSWSPQTKRELWGVAFDVMNLLIKAVRILPQLEEQYFGKKSDIDINQLVQALNKHFIAAVPSDAPPKGVATLQLAHCYCRSNNTLNGDPGQEARRINAKMRRLSSQFTPIGLGKNNALLFTLEDAVRILQYALKNENAIAADQATFLAQNALEDVKSTSVEKKDTPKSQTQKNQAC